MFIIDNDNNIMLTRGDTAVLNLEVTIDGEAYDYSGDLVQFTVKKNTNTNNVVIQKTFNGTSITIDPEDTSGLNYQTFVYDVQIITQNGRVFTVIPPANFTIAEEVNFYAGT